MSIIKFIGKLLLSKYQDDQDLEKISAKPKSNMIATTTIINQKKISRVIHSYSALDHPLIRIHKNTSKRPKARFIPIAESSAISTKTMCNSCLTKKKSKKYCKCCGKTVRPSATKKCVIWIEDNQSYYRHKQIISSGRNDKFKNVDVRNRKLKSCLKKSKAMTNIKQIEYKSFLSSKILFKKKKIYYFFLKIKESIAVLCHLLGKTTLIPIAKEKSTAKKKIYQSILVILRKKLMVLL